MHSPKFDIKLPVWISPGYVTKAPGYVSININVQYIVCSYLLVFHLAALPHGMFTLKSVSLLFMNISISYIRHLSWSEDYMNDKVSYFKEVESQKENCWNISGSKGRSARASNICPSLPLHPPLRPHFSLHPPSSITARPFQPSSFPVLPWDSRELWKIRIWLYDSY